MGIAVDIVRAWRHPKVTMAGMLKDGVREDRALFFLLLACVLNFVAQMPRLWRDAVADPSIPFDARVGGALLGWLFLAPLALYAIAAVTRVVGSMFRGKGTWYSARLALFWALLVAAPLFMINGLVNSVANGSLIALITGVTALAMFLSVWIASLFEAESKGMTV